MHSTNAPRWYVSLHGGHTAEFCDHGEGRLRDVLEAAVAKGFSSYGVSEHAARVEDRFLYPEERDMGWTIEKVQGDFVRYAETVFAQAEEFAERLTVLRGMETEVVPADRYAELMLGYRQRFSFDYMVGSVHYVDEMSIDSTTAQFEEAVEALGGLERLGIRYYHTVAEMTAALKPEIVGHFDVIRKLGRAFGDVATPAIRAAAGEALEVVRQHDGILDLNTAGLRKGLDTPYPDVWVLGLARDMNIPFALGDDSHAPEQVGAGFHEGRDYLLSHGIETVTILQRDQNGVSRSRVPLTE
jgi:histidinol-phosphatase (PHP family)